MKTLIVGLVLVLGLGGCDFDSHSNGGVARCRARQEACYEIHNDTHKDDYYSNDCLAQFKYCMIDNAHK